MAQGKKSFIVYADWKDVFDELPNEDAGLLIKHIFAYVNDENPISENLLIRAVFANIKTTLKRDLCKYEKIREKRSLAGKASANKRQQVLTSVESVGGVLCDTVTVTDTDTVKEDIKKGSEIKISVPSKIDFLDLAIEEFKRIYEESNELPYVVMSKGKERSAIGKLTAQYKSVHPDHNSDETIKGLGLYFDKVVNINDSWLRSNMTLPILMSKFNEVNNILRNGKSTSNKGGSDKEFFSVIKGQLSGR